MLTTPPLTDLAAMKAGLFFGPTTSPSATTAQEFLDAAAHIADSHLERLGLPEDVELSDLDDPALQAWYSEFILNTAMAQVWGVISVQAHNPYKEHADVILQRLFSQPQMYGFPVTKDMAAAPFTVQTKQRLFGGAFDSYIKRGGGF